MWIGSTIYFNSDRTGTFNLFAFDVASKKVTQVTSSTTWDVRWPSDDPRTGRIVYELDGSVAGPRHPDRQEHRRRRDRAGRWAGAAAGADPGREPGQGLRAQPARRARAVRGARRHLHGPYREGADAQPDAQLGRARQVAPVVAGRIAHRVRLGPERRGRGLRRDAGREREAPGDHERRQGACATLRRGRQTGPGSRSATRTGASMSSRWRRRRACRSWTRRAGRCSTTPGPRRAGISPSA